MGELCKFKIISGFLLFATINFMLADSSQNNVESVFILLEKVGQTLDRNPKTTNRFKDQLKLMLRIINVKNLDFKQTPLVDYAYNLYKPHPVNKRIKPSTSVYLFVKEILIPNYRIKITKVSTKLRKLHYPEQESILLKALMEELNTNESCHSQLAYIVTNVSRIHPSIGICLVDLLLETVHRGMYEMEVNNMQRRTSEIKFLAELYSLKLVSTEVLIATLYLIIKKNEFKK
jgi:regulator of nonsense transcripts 2